jgi:hypothetical protein
MYVANCKQIALGLILLFLHIKGMHCCEKKIQHEITSTQEKEQSKTSQKQSVMMSIMHCPQLHRIPYGPWRSFVAPAAASIDPILPLTVRPNCVLQHKGEFAPVATHFNHDGVHVVSVANQKVHMWPLGQKGSVIKDSATANLDNNVEPFIARFNKAGTALLVGHFNGVGIYDSQTGKCLLQNDDIKFVTDADFNHDESQVVIVGKRMADANVEKLMALWHLQDNSQHILDKETTRSIACASFNADGSKIVSSVVNDDLGIGADEPEPSSAIKIWDSKTGKPIHVITIQERVGSTCCSPDGTKILGSLGNPVAGYACLGRVWDMQTGQQVGQFKENDMNMSVATGFNHNGTQIVSATDHGRAYIRDANSFKKLMRLAGPTKCASSVEFNHNGTQVLMLRNGNKKVPIWNVPLMAEFYKTAPAQSHLIHLLAHCNMIIRTNPNNPKKPRKVLAFYLSSIPKAKKMNQEQTQEFMHEARTTLSSFDPLVKAAIIKKFKIQDADNDVAKS